MKKTPGIMTKAIKVPVVIPDDGKELRILKCRALGICNISICQYERRCFSAEIFGNEIKEII